MAKANDNLQAMSDSLAAAAEMGGRSTVMVNARRRFPASGVAIEKDLVLTASHAVEHDKGIEILLSDGSEVKGKLLGRDSNSDLAVIQLDKAEATPAKMAKGEPQVGQLALALGRPSQSGVQASFGIVSALSGPSQMMHGGFMEAHLRTDAVPYPGFSGGPLVDIEGKILGINTSGFGRGRSVTILAKNAWKIAESIKEHGGVKRGFLGIRGQIVELPEENQKALGREQSSGILLLELEDDGPAAASKLRVSDIVVGLNGAATKDHEALMAHLSGDLVGKEATVEVLRGDKVEKVKITVAERVAHEDGKNFTRRHFRRKFFRHGRHSRRGHWGWRRP